MKEVDKKLKKIYTEICSSEYIYTKKELIEFINSVDFLKDDNAIFFPIYIDKYDDDNIEEGREYLISKDILLELENFDDNQLFMIDTLDNNYDKIISRKLRETIFSDKFSNEERSQIINIFIESALKYNESEKLTSDDKTKKENTNFIKNCSVNDFILKYLNDDNFCEYIMNIYTIHFYYEETKAKLESPKIITINDLIREKFAKICNKNISLGATNKEASKIIVSFLNGQINSKDINKFYKEELNDINVENLANRKYITIIMITDFLRTCEIIYRVYEDIYYEEKEYLDFIDNNDINIILERFKTDENFAINIVSRFMDFNLDLSLETRKSCKNMKIIKKINPLYKLDFQTEKDYLF